MNEEKSSVIVGGSTLQNIKMSDTDNTITGLQRRVRPKWEAELQEDFRAMESGTFPGPFTHAVNNYWVPTKCQALEVFCSC